MSEVTIRRITADSLWQRIRDSLPPGIICALVALIGLLIPALLIRYPMQTTIVGVVGLLGVALVLSCPFVGLLIFLGLLYLRPEESFPALAGARFTLMVSLVALFAWAVNTLLCRERFNLRLPVVQCFLGFVLVAIGSTALSGSDALIDAVIEMLKLLILFVLIVHLVNTEPRLRVATGTLVLFTAILGVRTIWQYQNGQAPIIEGEARAMATGIFGDPNDLALAMAMALPLTLGTGFGLGAWRTRLWNLATVPVLIWTIYVTNSRGGMVALGATVLLFFGRRLGRLGIVVGAVASLALFAFGPSRLSQMSSQEESAQGRVLAWQAGMKMLQSSPVWGVGKEQFLAHHPLTAHNSLVLCLGELGLLGTALWIGLFYFALRGGARPAPAAEPGIQAPKAKGIRSYSILFQLSLITFMVGGFFLSRTYTPPLYVYLGLAVAASQVEADRVGRALPQATVRDWARIAAITLGSLGLVMVLVKLWS